MNVDVKIYLHAQKIVNEDDQKMKGLSTTLLASIVIFIGVLAISLILFNPGGIVSHFMELLNKMSGEGVSFPTIKEGNKALHVHLEIDDSNSDIRKRGIYIYEFHLFNEFYNHIVKKGNTKTTLYLSGWKKDKCTVFISDNTGLAYQGGFFGEMYKKGNRIYYVEPGTIIQDGIKNLKEVLSKYEGKCECITKDEQKGEYTVKFSAGCKNTIVCNDVIPTLEAQFESKSFDNCDKYSDCKECCPRKNCCELLKKNELGTYEYKIKYGIICGFNESGKEAYWFACTSENDGIKINAGEKKYVCVYKNNVGLWIEESADLLQTEKNKNERVICRVYATRLGMVGGQTAYGHIIKPNDRFASLPYNFKQERQNYLQNPVKINITYKGKSVVVPVLEIGPWNELDNYWETKEKRNKWGVDDESLKNFPNQCIPMAQAAYSEGWHYGYTVSRSAYDKETNSWIRIPYDPKTGNPGTQRQVTNPAGIDLADGTWNDLGMKDNDWVEWYFVE